MFRAIAASSRGRLLSFGLLTVAAAITITTDAAQARRHRGHRHHVSRESSYSPPFSSIVVDANSGNVLQANAADGSRHPASLTKIMTLYLLFERLESGTIALDDDLKVSEHASEQAPTKLGLNPGQTIEVEDAIKGLVTRSANDAAVTIAEAIGGSEENFAKLMTRKARALGMSKTVYRNASGLPDDNQVTTARDQSILGRSIQERFPKYYKYFATNDFRYHGSVIRNHNHLLGQVEGVDGIKTGYTRASGFNLVTSIRRGNRHLVAVVLGGRSASSRDGVMRGLLAEHMNEGSTKRTVAAIAERPEGKSFDDRVSGLDPSPRVDDVAAADEDTTTRENSALSTLPATTAAVPAHAKVAAAQPVAAPPPAAVPQRPAPLTSGVIEAQPLAAIPGSTAPLQPVKVKTLVVRAAPVKIASAGPPQIVAPAAVPATPAPVASIAPAPADRGAVAKDMPRELPKTAARIEQPASSAEYGIGKGILGVLPASSKAPGAMAYADVNARTAMPAPAPATRAAAEPASSRPTLKAGTWIIQVGALESEAEASKRLSEARTSAAAQLGKAEQFTETVEKGDKRLYRARFANLDRDRAEAACKALKRSDISCIAIKN
jgi:D-alanyl-D-alanine carboxypeptidase